MKKSVRKKVYARIPSLNGAELHQSLQYLDNERHVLNVIFNSLQEAIILTDVKGTLILYNDAAQRLLALPTNQPTIAPLWHWIPLLKSFFTKTSKKILPDVLAKETQLLYPEHRWVRLHVHRFLENTQDHFVIVLQDITQEHNASEKRVQQERLDSIVQLASEVAHELGNPLNSIHIHLQLLHRHLATQLQHVHDACAEHLQTMQQTLASLQSSKTTAGLQNSIQTFKSAIEQLSLSPSATQSLRICQEEVHRLDEIIQHFLKAVRPQPLNLKRDNPIPSLKTVLSVLQPQLDDSNISIEWSIATPLTTIFIDTARLHQVFFNVLKNAMEAIGSNGRIHISCYQTEYDWVVAFADSGGGISGQQAMRMLSDQNGSQKPNGHGIGMLIIRRIMQEHNGCIEIESKAHIGSIVYLKFPLPEPALRQLENDHHSVPSLALKTTHKKPTKKHSTS